MLKQLTEQLCQNTGLKSTIAKNLSTIICGIIEYKDVKMSQIARKFSGKASNESNIRKIQRTLSTQLTLMHFIHCIFNIWFLFDKKLLLSIDRTNWKLGKHNFNILMIGIVRKDVVIPIIWMLLNKQGNSNQEERINLLKLLLKHIPVNKIDAIVGDREFIGEKWLGWLYQKGIHFCIRMKSNQYVWDGKNWIKPTTIMNHTFQKIGTFKLAKEDELGYEISGYCLGKEWLILISFAVENPGDVYRKRWKIETLFQNFKGRGFNLENTHITDANRLNNLLVCVGLAAILCYKAGELSLKIKCIHIKKHGRPAISIFRRGLDTIQRIFKIAFSKVSDDMAEYVLEKLCKPL